MILHITLHLPIFTCQYIGKHKHRYLQYIIFHVYANVNLIQATRNILHYLLQKCYFPKYYKIINVSFEKYFIPTNLKSITYSIIRGNVYENKFSLEIRKINL